MSKQQSADNRFEAIATYESNTGFMTVTPKYSSFVISRKYMSYYHKVC